jgi:hypothetical protein
VREDGREEFSGISKLLGLDAQSVPMLRIQCIETLATFQDPLPSATQLFHRQGFDRAFPQHASSILRVARPIARLDPSYGIESKIAKARALHCCTCARNGILAFLPKLPRDQPYSRLTTLAVRNRFHHTFQENLKFPRRAKLAGNPFEFPLQRLGLGVGQHIGEQRDCCPQSPERHSHLVQGFRVAGEHHGLVGDELA